VLLPARDREPLLGDALEAYNDTLRKFGGRSATYDYAKEVFYAIVAAGWRCFIRALVTWRRGQ
jgi:hypothetical protein